MISGDDEQKIGAINFVLSRSLNCFIGNLEQGFAEFAWKFERTRMMEGQGQRAATWIAAACLFVVLMLVTPKIPQDQKYHNFADKQNFFG
jgi:hypothetical protein